MNSEAVTVRIFFFIFENFDPRGFYEIVLEMVLKCLLGNTKGTNNFQHFQGWDKVNCLDFHDYDPNFLKLSSHPYLECLPCSKLSFGRVSILFELFVVSGKIDPKLHPRCYLKPAVIKIT